MQHVSPRLDISRPAPTNHQGLPKPCLTPRYHTLFLYFSRETMPCTIEENILCLGVSTALYMHTKLVEKHRILTDSLPSLILKTQNEKSLAVASWAVSCVINAQRYDFIN